MRRSITIMLTLSIAIICFSKGAPAQENILKVVYIDPEFDNDQLGPVFKQQDKAIKLLLNIANSLKRQLSARGAVAYVSGEQGVIKDIEDRIDQAKEKHASLFISLALSRADKDSIRIHFPKFEKKTFKKEKDADKAISDEMFNLLGNSGRETVSAESKTIATLISKNMSKLAVENSVKLTEGNSYLLKVTLFPTIIIEFELSNIDKLPFYLNNEDGMRQLSNAIAGAIDEFLSYPVGSPKRMGGKNQ